ncbi:MAG: 23S rRNA (adenine(2503)-C(2))-methyltransferase RlmN [Rickettsiales bacterium]|nr:23S rRNA (adenine(2503)-C(2))-methyltransferase RlmN [Rickettsiales bacterium]
MTQKNLFHFSKIELEKKIIELDEKPFRAKQIWNWLYVRGAKSFSEMTNISKVTREALEKNFIIELPKVSKDLIAFDGTRKFLVKFSDNREVETVFIPEETTSRWRGTLCISSQVGCTLACKFCHTGTQTWVRNLEFHEIIAQVLIAKNLIEDWNKNNHQLTNIVFMGMGEPFFNYENVAKAVKILNDIDGLNISARKITISTSGLVPEILQAGAELKTNLAISLHATNDKLRTEIMAINKKYPLKDLLSACQIYNKLNPNQKITFEYVMLENINDNEDQARELVALIKKFNLNAKINLIPFNAWDGCDYKNSKQQKILQFQKILKDANLVAPIRKTRGDDVMAACGQLKSSSQREKSRLNQIKID